MQWRGLTRDSCFEGPIRGAKTVGVGRYCLYPLAAAGQAGVERAFGLMQTELERDMRLMGRTGISDLSRDNLRFR